MKIGIWAIVFIVTGLCCCSKSVDTPSEDAHAWIQIQDSMQNTPSAYVVSVDDQTIYCGGDDSKTSKKIQCNASGVSLSFHPDSPIHLFIKTAQGAFFEDSLSFADRDTLRIHINPIPAFIHNEDQVTGFTKKDGWDLFKSMAYRSTSELGDCYSLKFIITDLDSQPVVHFQNTNKHKLHYSFAKLVLGDTRNVDDFENETYYTSNRSMIAGTLVYYPSSDSGIGLTFFPSDIINVKQILLAHRSIEERMQFLPIMGSKNRLYYLPEGNASEQVASEHSDEFQFQDVNLKHHAELFRNIKLQILNPGIAYGTLRRLTPEALQTAVLSSQDIVILTRLPARLPIVAASISEELQTPLSHVNLAACARNTPNIAFNGAVVPDSILNLQDSLVRFEVTRSGYSLSKATHQEAQAFWLKQVHDTIHLSSDIADSGFHDFSSIGFAYAKQVGVKAANLAELHKVIPDHSPDGFAIPFYYYEQFLSYAKITDSLCLLAQNDCESEGRAPSLCTNAQQACNDHSNSESLDSYIKRVISRSDFRSDSRKREAMLDGIRYLFRHIPVQKDFAKLLDQKVLQSFGSAPIHMRSSTNSEDLDDFNGAGLYESVGASQVPGNLPSEEIRKVWASVWNWSAYEERSWWNIDQLSVKMGVAVHKSFPNELANGVVLSQNIADLSIAGIYANIQKGEVSITNPTDGSNPEIISIIPAPSGKLQAVHLQYSSLSPDTSILNDAEMKELNSLVNLVQIHFADLYKQSPYSMILDIEFKVTEPDRHLIFKQVRPYIP